MNVNPYLVFVILLLGFQSMSYSAEKSDVQRVKQNLRAQLLEIKADDRAALINSTNALKSMKEDGSWADQDYADRGRVHVKTSQHLTRLENLAKAYAIEGTPHSKNDETLKRILTSLKFWFDVEPKNENWWWADIGWPNTMGRILLVLDDACPDDLRKRGIAMMDHWKKWESSTGANLADGAQIQMIRGCLLNEEALVAKSCNIMWKTIRMAALNEESVQADFSFHQHGAVLYETGYGSVFIQNAMGFVRATRETKFAPQPEVVALLADYIMHGQMWMVRGAAWDWGAAGRSITRSGRKIGAVGTSSLKVLAALPSPRKDEIAHVLAEIAKSPVNTYPFGNRAFWRSDYMAHRRPDYFVSARMYSKRTFNTDGLINGENKKTHHIADGATCIMRTGEEFFNIYPVWDWHRIPGTTIEQNTTLIPQKVQFKGKTDFVGVVSDGEFGCATMDLVYEKLSAKKSWFFFDREVVCLGTDIHCDSSNPVFTSINQCLLRGPVEKNDASGTRWIWHDGVGYAFLDGTKAQLTTETQRGSWGDIGARIADPVETPVFNLWVDHGANVRGGNYSYVLLPGMESTQMPTVDLKSIQVLANDAKLQAVLHGKLGVLQAVCREAQTFKFESLDVSVNTPCLIMLRREGSDLRVTVADPVQVLKQIQVTIRSAGGAEQSLRFDLPGNTDAGKSVSKVIPVP